MTCIIGFGEKGTCHMLGDSGGFSNWEVVIRKDPKIFTLQDKFLIGFSGSFRACQIIRFSFNPPAKPDNISDFEYLASLFVEDLRVLLKDKGYSSVSENVEGTDSNFMVGFNGNIYVIHSDFQVESPLDNISSIGCGSNFAIAAFDALTNIKQPKARLIKAMEIANKRCIGISKPYRYERL